MSAPFRVDWQAASDRGRVRAVNEDSFLALPERGLWAVADGMGGHEGGDWASSRLVAALAAAPRQDGPEDAVAAAADAIHAANAAIWDEARARRASMGTTAAALVLRGRRFAALWAGDSRVWLKRGDALVPLTRDHSQVQMMVDRGLLTPDEARDHPMGHVLARAVGVEPTLELDVVADVAAAGDLFLLTSDGVHGVLSPDEIMALLARHDVALAPAALVARGMERGSTDNLTAVAVQLREPTLVMPVGAREDAA